MAQTQPHDPAVQSLEALASATVLESLVAVCDAMGSTLELKEVLNILLERTLNEMRAQQGSILLFDQHRDQLAMLAAIGLPEDIVSKGYIPRKGSIAEWVIENNRPLILNDRAQSQNYQALDDRRKLVSSMCVPLRAQGLVIGTINLNRTDLQAGAFDDRALDTMVVLASLAAIFIENSRLHAANMKTERLAAIGQTVAGISHCIKNVLTGVRGGMSLIDMAIAAKDWELMTKARDILHRNIERLASIVLDMLDYSKERKPSKVSIGAQSLAAEVMATVASEAELRGIELEARVDPAAGEVLADSQQIYRCVLNLAQNALDITPKGGKVWIGAARTSDPAVLKRLKEPAAEAVVLRVGDTGPGVAPENRLDIFEPFFSTKGSKGTGLGLAVTRKIVLEHGGLIEVETVAPDPAVFAIILPA
jgi:signal transduction histidine kinase